MLEQLAFGLQVLTFYFPKLQLWFCFVYNHGSNWLVFPILLLYLVSLIGSSVDEPYKHFQKLGSAVHMWNCRLKPPACMDWGLWGETHVLQNLFAYWHQYNVAGMRTQVLKMSCENAHFWWLMLTWTMEANDLGTTCASGSTMSHDSYRIESRLSYVCLLYFIFCATSMLSWKTTWAIQKLLLDWQQCDGRRVGGSRRWGWGSWEKEECLSFLIFGSRSWFTFQNDLCQNGSKVAQVESWRVCAVTHKLRDYCCVLGDWCIFLQYGMCNIFPCAWFKQ